METEEASEETRLSDGDLHDLLVQKLTTVIEEFECPNWFVNLSKCGSTMGVKECGDCGELENVEYQCSQKWCPRCNWKITKRRKKVLGLWANTIRNPMHLILTQKNFAELDGAKHREHTKALQRVRRQQVMRNVKGGCVSVELTNNPSEAWHLHSHWLVDCRYVSMKELAIEWGKQVGQEFGIVRYSKLEEKDYVNEVAKYVCKPAEMVTWTALEILAFIEAARGRRFFFTFGNLNKHGKKIREFIKASEERKQCKCKKCESIHVNFEISSSAANSAKRRARDLILGRRKVGE